MEYLYIPEMFALKKKNWKCRSFWWQYGVSLLIIYHKKNWGWRQILGVNIYSGWVVYDFVQDKALKELWELNGDWVIKCLLKDSN